ncbi:MAG TPA: hypothetical protein VK211_13160 [Kamptonema sp.]|nr:hypothetical protein [Kamptonema sp.]
MTSQQFVQSIRNGLALVGAGFILMKIATVIMPPSPLIFPNNPVSTKTLKV